MFVGNEMKTIIVLLGNARGGEEAWETMYKNLVTPHDADLALLFGEAEHEGSLYEKAKYVWEIEEYDNWRTYYEKVCKTDTWERIFEAYCRSGLSGGIDGHRGSGAIIFAFRHFLKTKRNILEQYDRIILTRSDHYYLREHPILNLEYVWVPKGEDYRGITDRHHVFSPSMIDQVLGVVEFLDDPETYRLLENCGFRCNPEMVLWAMFKKNGVSRKIRRFPRNMFSVARKNEQTRWRRGSTLMPGSTTLYLKASSEYQEAINEM